MAELANDHAQFNLFSLGYALAAVRVNWKTI